MLIGNFDMNSSFHALELESSLESIDAVEKLICAIKEKHSIAEDDLNGIWIALNEAVTNAIKHGNKFDLSKKVSISVQTKQQRYLCFTVKDEGCGFDPAIIPDPTTAECIYEPNGRGVYLINKLADQVTFSNNGTIVEMCFDLYKN